ncbi:MAG: hypothetical protein ACLUAR_16775 [Pilosibacter sp.]
MLYVSHDRYFINQTATRILELTGQTDVELHRKLRLLSGKHDAMMTAHFKRGVGECRRDRRIRRVEDRSGGVRLPERSGESGSGCRRKARLEGSEGRTGPPEKTPERFKEGRG